MALDISGVHKVKFYKPNDTDTIWMTLSTRDGEIGCTFWTNPRTFATQMIEAMSILLNNITKDDRFESGWIGEEDAPIVEAKTT